MTKQLKEYISSLIFLIFGIALYIGSNSITTFIENDVGPAFMPKLVGICIIALSVIKLILAYIEGKKSEDKEDKQSIKLDKGGIYTILLIFIYVLILEKVGFIISTILYLFLQIQILSKYDEHDIKLKLAISIIAPIVIYILFTKGFQLMLPRGIL